MDTIKRVGGGKAVIDIVSDYRWFELFDDRRTYFLKDFAKYIEVNQIDGDVAEAGVYRGNFAKYINAYFDEKKVFLFDTFTGFSEKDISDEIEHGDEKFINSRFNNVHEFENTSIEHVMKKMKYPQNVVIKKGYFPDSAGAVDNTFCFVNLDMDLYLPTLGGLRFFYPRLNEGGCILCHDYFANCLGGVKRAIEQYENEIGVVIKKTPIGDGCSIALMK